MAVQLRSLKVDSGILIIVLVVKMDIGKTLQKWVFLASYGAQTGEKVNHVPTVTMHLII